MYHHFSSPSNSSAFQDSNNTIQPLSPTSAILAPIHYPLSNTPLDSLSPVKTNSSSLHYHPPSSSSRKKKTSPRENKSKTTTSLKISSNHNTIEKRRRERINDKIDQLKYLIPSCCPDTLPYASMHQPLHKLSILQAAIEYIHHLHTQLVDQSPCLDLSDQGQLTHILSHARRQQQQQT
ncbi:helix-loop-helix DNA-binding domain-domain-containing protein [Absidia repens]|uniref:Helix-loop-helix DNA-binding domain-domain-containing protein n=1 Tax=Absidia repens TaxID=90262 RepID=A0A1X2IWY6_9FUNG|nr:helix-loop-helix DNA-binding domain-domain-containing protein [Absidia repens]